MDIWSWLNRDLEGLEEDAPALVHPLASLPGWARGGEHGRIDASLPPLVTRLMHLDRPWLEVFARHWGLQSRVSHRYDVRDDALQEAIALLERARHPDAADCPQSVCVSQDVCAAYGVQDGPGYATERIAIAEETLARIDRDWPCWSCITVEHVSAWIDSGDLERALSIVDDEVRSLAEADRASAHLLGLRSRILLDLGRPDEALVDAGAYDVDGRGPAEATLKSLRRARALAALGRSEEALAEAPDWVPIRGVVGQYPDLLALWAAGITDGWITWDLEYTQRITEMVKTLARHEANRHAVDEGLRWAEIALEDASWSLARAFLGIAEARSAHLARPLGADVRIAEMKARIDAAAPAPHGVDLASAVAEVEALSADAVDFDRLEVTASTYPAWVEGAVAVARHWTRRGWPDRSRALLDAALVANPMDPVLLDARFDALVQAGAWGDLEEALGQLGDDLDPSVELHRRWYLGMVCHRAGDLDAAVAHTAYLWDHLREIVGPAVPRRLAAWRQQAGDDVGALEALEAIVAGAEVTPRDHWFRMELATVLGHWDRVRESAAAVDLEIAPGGGPIAEDWELITIVVERSGRPLLSSRTGPCTARVVTITHPAVPERHGEEWAFDPFFLAEGPPRRYRANRVMQSSDFVGFALDGPRLSEADFTRVMEEIARHGGSGFLASGDRYEIVDPDGHERHLASFVKLALPTAAMTSGAGDAIHLLFESLAGAYTPPLIWPALREHLGDDAGAAADRAIEAAWGML